MEVEASQFVPRPMDSPHGAGVSHGADVDHPFASFGGDAQMGAHDMAVRGDNEDGASDHALLDPDMVLETRSHSARGTDAAGIPPEQGALDTQRIHGADECPSQEGLGAASPDMSRGAAVLAPAHCVWVRELDCDDALIPTNAGNAANPFNHDAYMACANAANLAPLLVLCVHTTSWHGLHA